MKNKIILELTPDSSFLLGGVSVNPAFDSVTALTDDGLPFLTATALKGALRMEFEAFIRGIIAHDNELLKQGHRLCDLEADAFEGCGKCLFCSLFGGGNEEGKLRFNAAYMKNGDTVLPQTIRHQVLDKGKRDGVSISRTMRKAKDKSYYSALTFPDLKHITTIVFDTHIDLQAPLTDLEYTFTVAFFKFLEQTGFFMGARKSTGLGFFRVTKAEIPDKNAFIFSPRINSPKNDPTLFRVKLKTHEPLVVGQLKNQYIVDTLPYIPASTMGGSIGFGLVKSRMFGDEKETNDKVNELFNIRKTLSPFHFYPGTAFPRPVSLRRKKGSGKEGEILDVMLSDFVISKGFGGSHSDSGDKAGDGAEMMKLLDTVYRNHLRHVPICDKPETSYHIKVALSREFQKNREGMLYALESIRKATCFHGLIIGEPWLDNALENLGELFIGGKRTRGYGRTELVSIERLDAEELMNSPVNIDKALRELARDYGIHLPDHRTFFALDLLNDLDHGNKANFKSFMEEELFAGLDMSIEMAYPEMVWRGGFDFRNKKEKPLKQKMGAGSAFLVSVPTVRAEEMGKRILDMIVSSINYNWDSTPLFRLNNPQHIEMWR